MTELRQSRKTRQQKERMSDALWLKMNGMLKGLCIELSFWGKLILSTHFEPQEVSQGLEAYFPPPGR